MQIGQVTLGSAATQMQVKTQQFQSLTIQNNTAHALRVGDATVSATKGISIPASTYMTFSGLIDYSTDLSEWFLFGTDADKIDYLLIP